MKKEEKIEPTVADFAMLQKPIVTEKTASDGSVVFRIPKTCSKDRLKRAIQSVFDVKVDKIRTCNYMGKKKRTRAQTGKRADFKKAYVTLKDGDTISVVEGL